MFEAGDPEGEVWNGPRVAAGEALESELAALCGIGNATVAAQVRLVGAALAEGLWRQGGIRSADHWVGWQMGVSSSRARRLVAMARRGDDLPKAFAAFAAGELSEDQMVLICRHTPSPCDEAVTEFARYATFSQLSRTLSRYQWAPPTMDSSQGPDDIEDGAVDSESEPEPDPQPDMDSQPDMDAQRKASFHFDDDGLWHLFAQLAPDEGAAFEAALTAARDDLFHARFGDHTDGHTVNEISWADALAHVADLAASPEATGHPVRERHRIHLHLHGETLSDALGRPGPDQTADKWTLNLHMGPALPDSLRRYLLCDTALTPVFERLGVAVSVGRAQRTVPDRTRTLVEERDRGCRAPGCTARRWLHVHHLTHWEDGGRTDTNNLICLCAWHHRAHHQGQLGIRGNADERDGLVFTDARGHRIPPYRPPKAPGDPPSRAAKQHAIDPDAYRHPLGEKLDDSAVYFSSA